jgi:type II secretory pathway component GspD/PulD (secretin)
MTKSFRVASVAAMLALVLAASAGGAGEWEKKTIVEKLHDPISIALKGATPDEVFSSFAQILGLEAAIDPRVEGPINIGLERVSLRTVLTAVCESIQCSWTIERDSVLHIRPLAATGEAGAKTSADPWDRPLSVSLVDALVGEVIASFAQILNVAIDVAPELADEKVTIELENVPARDGLEQICERVGADLVELAGSPGSYRLIEAVRR